MKPRLLDLFCKAGGAGKGYADAGFEVVGVDHEPQPNYPFPFVEADAIDVLELLIVQGSIGVVDDVEQGGVLDYDWAPDAVHASPPCQRWAEGGTDRKLGDEHPDLLTPTRELLKQIGLPYVIENIPTAPMPDSILLCGVTFGLPIVRHRRFEIHPPIGLVPSLCRQSRYARSVDHPGTYPYAQGSWEAAWREHVLPVVWPWMTLAEAGQAIPPAYTEFIGRHLLTEIEQRQRTAA